MAAQDILRLVVEADTSGAAKEFDKLSKQSSSSLGDMEKSSQTFATKTSTNVKNAATAATTAFASSTSAQLALAGAVVAAGAAAVNAASDYQEMASKTDAVFKGSSDDIKAWADGAAQDFGMSKTAALDAATSFGNMFLQLGFGAGEAEKMSTSITELATDFASFFNTNPADAVDAISAAFRGEYDAVQKFVPTINAAAVQQKALKMGLAETTAELTEQDKALASYQLIMEGAGEAAGDFDKTSDSMANQSRILQAEFENLKIEVGTGLLPAVSAATSALVDMIGVANKVTAPLGGVGKAIKTIVENSPGVGSIMNWGEMFEDGASGVDRFGAAVGVGIPILGNFIQGLDGTKEAAVATNAALSSVGSRGAPGAMKAINDLTESQRQGTAIANEYGRMGDIGTALGSYTADLEKAKQATLDLFNAQLIAAGGPIAQRAAMAQYEEAVRTANEAQKDNTLTTLEQQVAYDQAVTAALGLAQTNMEVAKTSGAADGGQQEFINTLKVLASSAAPNVRDQLNGVIMNLEAVGQQHPEPTVTLNDQASTPLLDVKSRLAELDGYTAAATVTVNTDAAFAKMSALERRIAATSTSVAIAQGFAGGTKYAPGGWAVVGEEGPELINLPKGAAVYTASQTENMLTSPSYGSVPVGAGGGGTHVTNVAMYFGPGISPTAVGKELKKVLAMADRNGVN
jgi:hypothetical protein